MDFPSEYRPSSKEIEQLEEMLSGIAGEGLLGAILRDVYNLPVEEKKTNLSPTDMMMPSGLMYFPGAARFLKEPLLKRLGQRLKQMVMDPLEKDVYMEVLGKEEMARAGKREIQRRFDPSEFGGWFTEPVKGGPQHVVIKHPTPGFLGVLKRLVGAEPYPLDVAMHESVHYGEDRLPGMAKDALQRAAGKDLQRGATFKHAGAYPKKRLPSELAANVAEGRGVKAPYTQTALEGLGLIPKGGVEPLSWRENEKLVRDLLKYLSL
jgi:hypothetical protein